ncbi:MAG: WG repeat-containing protein [Ruminococcus sp.]|nr:WG repeat-containing protein [Ruminococcus sp.]
MKKMFSRIISGLLCGTIISGCGIVQGAATVNAKPTRVPTDMGYTWHLEPTVEADNIYVSDYTTNDTGQFWFHNYVYIKKNGKYGFIDHDGNIVVEPVYDSCNALRYGMDYYRAVYDSKSGKTVTVSKGIDELDNVYDKTSWKYGIPDIDGLLSFGLLWSVKDNTVYGVMEDWQSCNIGSYSFIVQPATYSLEAYNSRRVETGVPMKDYPGIGDSELMSSNFGLADTERILVKPEYPYAYAQSVFLESWMYCAFSKDKEVWTVFDNKGNEIMAELEPFEDNYFYEIPWKPVSVLLYGEDEESFNRDFYCPAPFLPTEGVIAAKKNGECGYIDLSGNVLVRFGEFEDIRPVHNGLAWVKMNGKWGVIELLKKEGGNNQPETKDEPCDIHYPGGYVDDVSCTEEMFMQDSTEYHKDISTLAVALSMAAYDDGDSDHTGSNIINAYDKLGFDNKMMFGYSKCPDEYKPVIRIPLTALHIEYSGNTRLIPSEMLFLYSYGDIVDENVKNLYDSYLNGNPEIRNVFNMELISIEALPILDWFFGRNDRAFSIATKELDDTILVAFSFRGTSGFDDICTDLSFLSSNYPIKNTKGNTVVNLNIHTGFASFYQLAIIGWNQYVEEHGDYINGTGKQVKFLFTGHSLGAACANICGYAANRGAFGDFVTEKDIYTYTYATPNVVTDYSEDTLDYAHNIFNILNSDDAVPNIPIGYVKFGHCRPFKLEGKGYNSYPFISLHLRQPVRQMTESHEFKYYVEGVKNDDFLDSVKNWVHLSLWCPIDVEVYYKGELIGRVKDEAVDEENTLLPMFVDEDGGKSFVLPEDEDFEVRVTAYDSGSMNVRFQEVAMNGETVGDSYEYNNIPLENGKRFSVPVTANVSEQAVYVVDANGNRLSTVGKDGNEASSGKGSDSAPIVLIVVLSVLVVLLIISMIVLFRTKKKNSIRR